MPEVVISKTSQRDEPLESRSSIAKMHWPLIIAIGILGAAVAVLLTLSISQNQGHFVYALDDPYIHMAMAKNLSQHGVWGVTEYGFTSSSSSPLWTLLLSSIYVLVGVNELSPLILNVTFATLTICLVYVLLRRYELPSFYILAILLSIIFLTPLPAVIFTGMEHILHLLITISFVYLSARVLSKETSKLLELLPLFILAPLVTMVRYEGLFLTLVISVLFIIRKRLLHSCLLFGLAIIPIATYGMISISNGWYFLPNPVLLKASIPTLSPTGIGGFLFDFGRNLWAAPHITTLASIALVLFILQFAKQKTLWKDSTIMLIIFIGTTLLHMLFARTGWFYRYEAYLVALGMFVIAVGACSYLLRKLPIEFNANLIPKYIAISVLVFLLALPLAGRGLVSLLRTPQATTNIYEQQYQMGLFLREFYQEESVAANDIGAINYLADIRCLDLWGLGNRDVAEAKRRGYYDTRQIYNLAKQENIKVAVVYDHWFEQYGGIPSQWVKVGEWSISNNVVCGADTVSFYAVDTEDEDKLIQSLKRFSSQLPVDVRQSGKYTEYQ